jgi:hypothetical protein
LRAEASIYIDKILLKAPQFALFDADCHIKNLFSLITINQDPGEHYGRKEHNWEPDDVEVG